MPTTPSTDHDNRPAPAQELRAAYEAPTVALLGTLAELTLGGTNLEADGLNGSDSGSNYAT